MLRLKENNRSIITELQNTIQIELNKAISKLREDFERETSSLLRENKRVRRASGKMLNFVISV